MPFPGSDVTAMVMVQASRRPSGTSTARCPWISYPVSRCTRLKPFSNTRGRSPPGSRSRYPRSEGLHGCPAPCGSGWNPLSVYFKAFDKSCSSTKRSHFSSVSTVSLSGLVFQSIFLRINMPEYLRTACRTISSREYSFRADPTTDPPRADRTAPYPHTARS